ncbi:pro-neuregulin-4, membrane-bound isoform isoform X1 [Chrysemys picta bellii]|uniref:pro-neuregulin-4, membrane-bound isoform isoform X1 n=2 Tax=Chrysemys picta bellii TaxID=8478 RepID=UPI0032B16686
MGRLGNNRLWQLSSAWGARSASRGAWRPNGDDGLHHEELCGTSYGPFCLNGGICYMIPTVSSPFCRCIENYTGARCEEVLLPSLKTQIKSEPFAAFLASVVVLGILVIGTFYFLCRVKMVRYSLNSSKEGRSTFEGPAQQSVVSAWLRLPAAMAATR